MTPLPTDCGRRYVCIGFDPAVLDRAGQLAATIPTPEARRDDHAARTAEVIRMATERGLAALEEEARR